MVNEWIHFCLWKFPTEIPFVLSLKGNLAGSKLVCSSRANIFSSYASNRQNLTGTVFTVAPFHHAGGGIGGWGSEARTLCAHTSRGYLHNIYTLFEFSKRRTLSALISLESLHEVLHYSTQITTRGIDHLEIIFVVSTHAELAFWRHTKYLAESKLTKK